MLINLQTLASSVRDIVFEESELLTLSLLPLLLFFTKNEKISYSLDEIRACKDSLYFKDDDDDDEDPLPLRPTLSKSFFNARHIESTVYIP